MLSELSVSARKGHLAPNERSMRAKNDSFTLRSSTVFAISLVLGSTDHVTCLDAYVVTHMLHDALGVKKIMQTTKMRTRVHQSFIFFGSPGRESVKLPPMVPKSLELQHMLPISDRDGKYGVSSIFPLGEKNTQGNITRGGTPFFKRDRKGARANHCPPVKDYRFINEPQGALHLAMHCTTKSWHEPACRSATHNL